ncbi:MAG TPA: HGGxSTG domain-containing protein [Methylocella sp.]
MTRAGTPCQCPAMRGRTRCRLHGGLSPGAPRGDRNGNFKDGAWTAEAIEERRWLRSLVKQFGKVETGS